MHNYDLIYIECIKAYSDNSSVYSNISIKEVPIHILEAISGTLFKSPLVFKKILSSWSSPSTPQTNIRKELKY